MMQSTTILGATLALAMVAVRIFLHLRERPANIPPVAFSEEAQATIQRATRESAIRGAPTVTTEHLLMALLADGGSPLAKILLQSGVNVHALLAQLRTGVSSATAMPQSQTPLYESAVVRVFERSASEAFAAHASEIQSVHLLASMLCDRKLTASKMLIANGVTLESMRTLPMSDGAFAGALRHVATDTPLRTE